MFVGNDEGARRNAQALWSFGETRSHPEDRDYHACVLGSMGRSRLFEAFHVGVRGCRRVEEVLE